MSMRWLALALFSLFPITALQAQHCPPKGETQRKNGGNGSITWTSYSVKVDGKVCVERTVRVQTRTYVNWPAADIFGAWVDKDRPLDYMRCCFLDISTKNGDLEYGLLGSKLPTTVYQGDHETAQDSTWNVTGGLLSGNKVVPVRTRVTWLAGPDCPKTTEPCRIYRFTVSNSEAPVTLKWKSDLSPQFETSAGDGSSGVVLGSGETKTFEFVSKSGKPESDSVSLWTTEGNHVLVKPLADVK